VGKFWADKINLSPPRFVEVSVSNQENCGHECKLGVSILPVFIIFPIRFSNCSDSVVFCWFFFVGGRGGSFYFL